jgi:carbamoyltransferase
MPHHENHASFSYAASPFNQSPQPVMVTVLDGFGDDGAISLFLARDGRMERRYRNASFADSLGAFYSIISSTQGGWTTLSSEGRYMGAVAWGDQDRRTNPYYKRLREIFHFAPEGRVYVNRALANWQNSGEIRPYKRALERIIGKPIPPDEMWNPDRVLRVEDVRHPDATRDRVDLAAATQLVFEDAVLHIVEHFIRATGSNRLVMTGGTALNCLANMQLLEKFDRRWYRRTLGKDARLHLWVPPTPGDAGVPIGAAYSFALRAGAKPREVLQHAFYCGRAATSAEILRAIDEQSDVGHVQLGNITANAELDSIADLAALVVADDGVVGLYQGPAETGPRALGHRSILANPCNPRTLENINRLVKFREPIRPLAPMVTLEEATRLFELGEGAAEDRYNAYNYMVLTVRARPRANERVPAVVHRDGTARIQIVRPEHDPFTYAYLKAMGRRMGVEASVNTSLNVGSPIAQTPKQALDALRKAKALTGLLMLSAEGDAFMAWDTSEAAPKDGGERLRRLMQEWKALQTPVA